MHYGIIICIFSSFGNNVLNYEVALLCKGMSVNSDELVVELGEHMVTIGYYIELDNIEDCITTNKVALRVSFFLLWIFGVLLACFLMRGNSLVQLKKVLYETCNLL